MWIVHKKYLRTLTFIASCVCFVEMFELWVGLKHIIIIYFNEKAESIRKVRLMLIIKSSGEALTDDRRPIFNDKLDPIQIHFRLTKIDQNIIECSLSIFMNSRSLCTLYTVHVHDGIKVIGGCLCLREKFFLLPKFGQFDIHINVDCRLRLGYFI